MGNSYQYNYSSNNKEMLDYENRNKKAQKIINVLKDYYNGSLKDLTCLDIGCSGGIIAYALSKECKNIIGCDIDVTAVESAKEKFEDDDCTFIIADSMNLPFEDEIFDLVICNHIYEHVPDYNKLLDEIYRVLKKDGTCYFGAGNRYIFIEPHYKLPMLSWFPKKISSKYLKLFKKGEFYYENFLSLKGLRNLVGRKFKIIDYSIPILVNAKKYSLNIPSSFGKALQFIPEFILRIFLPIFPTYIWLLKK